MIQELILNQLIHNNDYFDKALPHLKQEYFEGEPERVVFGLVDHFTQTYNAKPTIEALGVLANQTAIPEGIWEKVVEILTAIEKPYAPQDFKWLIDETQKWMIDRAVYNVITDAVDIYGNKSRRGELGSIPTRMEEALVVGFDDDLGMIYWEMAGQHYDEIHSSQTKVPFTVEILNTVTNGGCWIKTLNALNAGINVGKAQPLSSKILTPSGWKFMGDIKVGDFVIAKNGKPTMVTGVYPQGKKPVMELQFWDGRKTKACREHLWSVYRGGSPEASIVIDTEEFIRLNSLKKYASKNNRLYIDLPEPVEYHRQRELEIPPYMLGVLLGDGGYTVAAGNCNITSVDDEILSKFEELCLDKFGCMLSTTEGSITYSIIKADQRSPHKKNPLIRVMKEMGIYGKYSYEKEIPTHYLYSSVEERFELLRGLMDTDGYVSANGSCDFSTSSKKLAEGVIELVRSLGGMAKLSVHEVKGHRDAYVVGIRFRPGVEIFHLSRKLERHNKRKKPLNVISLEDIVSAGEEECQCIMVEDSEHLYITDDFVVTHNTTGLIDLAAQYASQGFDVIYFTFEVAQNPLRHRMDCRVLNRPFSYVESLSRHEYVAHIESLHKTGGWGNIFIKEFPSGGAHAGHCRSYIKDLIKRKNVKPKILIFDYIGEMASERLPVSLMGQTDLYFGSIARECRALAMEFETVNWTALQFQRGMQNTKDMSIEGNADSITVPKVLDFQLGISIPEEYEQLDQAWCTVMKNRYANKSKMKHFIIGLNQDYQRLSDVGSEAQAFASGDLHKSPVNDKNQSVAGAPNTSLNKQRKLDTTTLKV